MQALVVEHHAALRFVGGCFVSFQSKKREITLKKIEGGSGIGRAQFCNDVARFHEGQSAGGEALDGGGAGAVDADSMSRYLAQKHGG
jgi:hypothetical protein